MSDLERDEKLIEKKKAEISALTYEIELIKENSVNAIKEISDPIQRTNLHNVWLSFNNDGSKFVDSAKEEKKRLREIEKMFFFENPKGLKLKHISLYGYGDAYMLTYVFGKVEFVINIPTFCNANKDNYTNMYYALLDCPNECTFETVFRTRNVYEIKEAITKFLSEKSAEKHLK